MKYFLIEQDMDYKPNLVINGLSLIAKSDDFIPKNAHKIPDHQVVFPIPKTDNQYLDILSQQFFMVTETVKDVLIAYEPSISFKIFCVIDKENKVFEYYFAPILRTVDAVEFNRTNKQFTIKEQAVSGFHIFRIGNHYENAVIVSLELAESLLRRNIVGANFHEVNMISSDKEVVQ